MASIATSARTLGTWRKNARGRNLSTIPYYSCYMLYSNASGTCAKFLGTPIVGANKKPIWVPKTLVNNLQGSNQVWVSKKI